MRRLDFLRNLMHRRRREVEMHERNDDSMHRFLQCPKSNNWGGEICATEPPAVCACQASTTLVIYAHFQVATRLVSCPIVIPENEMRGKIGGVWRCTSLDIDPEERCRATANPSAGPYLTPATISSILQIYASTAFKTQAKNTIFGPRISSPCSHFHSPGALLYSAQSQPSDAICTALSLSHQSPTPIPTLPTFCFTGILTFPKPAR